MWLEGVYEFSCKWALDFVCMLWNEACFAIHFGGHNLYFNIDLVCYKINCACKFMQRCVLHEHVWWTHIDAFGIKKIVSGNPKLRTRPRKKKKDLGKSDWGGKKMDCLAFNLFACEWGKKLLWIGFGMVIGDND